MILDIETAIVQRLTGRIGSSLAKIEAFPDEAKSYKMLHPKGAILVAYAGAKFSKPGSTDVVIQDAELHWTISVLTKNLRSHGGSYGYLDAVRASMLGWSYPGAKKMFIVDERFISQEDGVWMYGMTFAHELPFIQVDDDELESLLIRLTTNDPAFGSVEVVST